MRSAAVALLSLMAVAHVDSSQLRGNPVRRVVTVLKEVAKSMEAKGENAQ